MPIDASIPLQAKAPVFEQPDIAGTLANAAKLKAAQLDIAAKQNDEEFKDLAALSPENYAQGRALLVQKHGAQADKMLPPVYDKAALDNLAMSRLDIKDKLTLQQQKLEMELNQQKFGEEQRHNRASEAIDSKKADNPFGNSLVGKSYNMLLSGDPNSPAYALAASAATQPRYTPVTAADGTTQLVAVTPELPASIRRPGAPHPQSAPGVLTPPPMPGTTDNTPTTQGALLAPPPGANPRNYSVSPIAGTQGAPKLTDDQTKAAGFTDRTVASDKIINDLTTAGYSPSMYTDEIAESKLGNKFALTGQGQQFVQAKRDFVNAILRRESGAAISQSEFENANKQYFPQSGDKPETIQQKADNRQLAIQSLKRSAGPALKGSTGNNTGAHPSDWDDAKERRLQELEAKAKQ